MKNAPKDTFDSGHVADAAKLSGVGEFKLFMNAYSAWYGKEANEISIERDFTSYLKKSVVPFWVRHHIRPILNDPKFRAKNDKKRKIALIGYITPILFEYALLMYFLVWAR